MKLFSIRNKFKKMNFDIQLEYIDDKLKVRLWNDIYLNYFKNCEFRDISNFDIGAEFNVIYNLIWSDFLIQKSNQLPNTTNDFFKIIEKQFFKFEWYEIFDFIEFLFDTSKGRIAYISSEFTQMINISLEKEMSAYRIINGKIVEITSEIEIQEIERTINSDETSNSIKQHLKRSLELLSDRKNPDYRNSIKESISAVEALCIEITGEPKITLGQALKQIEKQTDLHKSLQSAFSNLYGFTSNSEGIRHALMDEPTLKQEDAIFILVSCSSFVNYLKQKVK